MLLNMRSNMQLNMRLNMQLNMRLNMQLNMRLNVLLSMLLCMPFSMLSGKLLDNKHVIQYPCLTCSLKEDNAVANDWPQSHITLAKVARHGHNHVPVGWRGMVITMCQWGGEAQS